LLNKNTLNVHFSCSIQNKFVPLQAVRLSMRKDGRGGRPPQEMESILYGLKLLNSPWGVKL
jgi:hypothetical protein